MSKYTPQDRDLGLVNDMFTYHPVKDEEQGKRYESIRAHFLSLAIYLLENCPPSPELTLALRSLWEAQNKAIGSISIHESKESPIKLTGIDK